MTIFNDALAVMDDVHDGFFHSAITYNGTPITADVNIGESLADKGDSLQDVGTIEVSKTDVASWSYRDTVGIDSDTWRVRHLIKDNITSWHLKIMKDERPMI